jgi:NAD(P)-dependent dehydrogenase (short-subunit alcohol dehydrogenase family)
VGRLDGRVAIVTGAGAGIGRGIARRFAAEGAHVVVAERDEQAALDTLSGLDGEHLAVVTDVTDKEAVLAAVAATVERFGTVDILVNNAWGGGSFGPLEAKTDESMEHGFRIAVEAALWAMQACFPHMQAQGRGNIISLCSLNGVNAHVWTAEYNVAKEGLRTLTRTAAREWARHGIVANVICPAARTEAYDAFERFDPENAALLLKQNPMGRMGDPEDDIGPVAVFLAGDDARYCTGNTLFVDGGGHINGVSWSPGGADE